MTNSSKFQRKWAVMTGGILAVVGIVWGIWSRWLPPQLGVDAQVFNTVDALFTAITSRDTNQLADCERRLKAYHEEGRISDAVAGSLDAIIQQTRKGQWEPAARRLYDFIRGQRGQVRTAVEKPSARLRGFGLSGSGLGAITLAVKTRGSGRTKRGDCMACSYREEYVCPQSDAGPEASRLSDPALVLTVLGEPRRLAPYYCCVASEGPGCCA